MANLELNELVSDLSQVRKNIRTLEAAVNSTSNELALDLIVWGTCFIAYKAGESLAFAPSKFIGYVDNELDEHAQAMSRRHGGDTNKALEHLFGSPPEANPKLEGAYQDYVESLGRKVAAAGNFGVPRRYWSLQEVVDRLPPGQRRGSITQPQLEAAYTAASEVFAGQRSLTDAADWLHQHHGLNRSSAVDFIRDYRCLIEGRVFHRAMSAAAMRFFIDRIWEEHGLLAARSAVDALKKHIAYWETHYKTNATSMRSVAEDFSTRVAQTRPERSLTNEFTKRVAQAMRDSPLARAARLANAAKLPAKITVAATAFVRNPDVV